MPEYIYNGQQGYIINKPFYLTFCNYIVLIKKLRSINFKTFAFIYDLWYVEFQNLIWKIRYLYESPMQCGYCDVPKITSPLSLC